MRFLDAVIFTFIIYLDHADGIFWLNDNIAEILAASCYKEVFSCQIRNASTDWLPLFCFKVFLNGLYLFWLYTIRKVSAVSLMPALLPAVVCHTNESLNKFCIVWGLVNGGRPTSELPSHLMNHEVKKLATNGKYRVIYHAHTTNVIALTFVLPLEDKVFTRELWEMATECPVVFPDGVGVVPWMVPGGRDIAVATSELMKKYDVAIWAHHGMFAAGEDFDLTFGLMQTVEKSAEILVKMLSMQPNKRQTITPQNFRDLAVDFKVTLPEEFLYEK